MLNQWTDKASTYLCFFLHWRYSPNLGLGLPPWNSPFHFGLLDLTHSVGLLGRLISSSQGLYLYTHIENTRARARLHTHTHTHTHTQSHQTSMLWVGFEPTISATVTGVSKCWSYLTTNSVALVRKRTIPTERPPLVGEVSANVSG
jgi:hypothetical protein